MDTIGDRVRDVIAASRSSQAAFATSVGMNATALSKALSGGRRFSSLELARIAVVGGTTVDWLIRGIEPPALGSAARTATVDSAPAVAADAELASDVIERAEVLAELGLIADPDRPHVPDDGDDLDRADRLGEAAARAIGIRLGDLGREALLAAIEECFGADALVTELEAGLDGFSAARGARALLALATTKNAPRQRFTIGHELGHILFGDVDRTLLTEDVVSASGAAERRANTFAAAFLMPRDEIDAAGPMDSVATIAELAWDLRVSPDSLSWRLFNLGRIDAPLRSSVGRVSTSSIASRLGRTAEHLARSVEAATARPPRRLVLAYLAAYDRGEMTLDGAAGLLGRDVSDLEADLLLDLPSILP